MKYVVGVLVAGLLAGCAATQDAADQIARDRAKSVVNGVVADEFPGVNAAPVTDCVIDNSSAQEILTVSQASITGVTDSTVETVLDIAKRPDTVNCIAENAIALF